jgi:hypothetical protein
MAIPVIQVCMKNDLVLRMEHLFGVRILASMLLPGGELLRLWQSAWRACDVSH